MIPKVIHYCWFGRNPLPPLAIKCIDSWKKFFPDYEIKEWNEDNFDVNIIPYTKEAYELFNEAYNLYCLFWGLNMGIIDTKDIQLEKSTLTSLEATLTKDTFEEPVKNELEAPQTLKGKLKNFIRKAVDCCIE